MSEYLGNFNKGYNPMSPIKQFTEFFNGVNSMKMRMKQ